MLYYTYFMFLFTEFVSDIKVRYNLGFWHISIILMIFLFNLSLISVSIFKDVKFDRSKKEAKKKWDEFEKVKVQMAGFLVRDANVKAKNKYGVYKDAKSEKSFDE